MDNLSQQQLMSSYTAFMTALFVGIADAFLCLIVNAVYRGHSPYFSSELLNGSYIIFGIIFGFSFIGLLYVLLLRYVPKGEILFIALFALLTFIFVFRISVGHFSADPLEDRLTRGLSRDIAIPTGICAFAGIPFLRHNKWFLDNVV